MLRIETARKLDARRVWAYLDAAGWRMTPPLPTLGLGGWSVVVSGPQAEQARNALPRYLRRLCVFSTLDTQA